jgi:hypothetical protein
MEVWRAYDVGNGKKIPYTKFESTKSSSSVALPTLNKMEDSDQIPEFCDVLTRKSRKEKETKTDAESHNDDSDTEDDTLFTCSEEGCVKTFQRFSSLQKHLDSNMLYRNINMLYRKKLYLIGLCRRMLRIWRVGRRTLRKSRNLLRNLAQTYPHY